LRPSLKINLALLLLSTGASIYALETTVTLHALWHDLPSVIMETEIQKRAKQAQDLGIDFDRRSRLEVVNDLRQKGVKAYPTSQLIDLFKKQEDGSLKSNLASGAEWLPLGWISNAVLVTCNESGEYLVYESDEHGFHNPKGLWHNEPIDIVAVGDSYTQGYCVPSDKNFVAVIRKQYPAILNLGMSGNGPLLMLATIKEYVQTVKPKVVLWFYYEGNDLRNLQRARQSALLRQYMVAGFSQRLLTQQPTIDHALTNYVETALATSTLCHRLREVMEKVGDTHGFLRVMKNIAMLRQLRGRLRVVYGTRQNHKKDPQRVDQSLNSAHNAEIDLFGKILLEAKESISAWGGKLFFIYLPDWHRYANPQSAEKNRDRVLQIANTIGLHVIDIHQTFKAQADPLALFPFRLYGHYNEEGHRLVAEEVLRSIALGIGK
jgi:lysophospholipase L1-like esterase